MAVLAAAAVGNTGASWLRVPYELVKQRLQAGMYEGSAYRAVASIYADAGVFGFFRGVRSQIVRDVPYAMATLLAYEAARGYRKDARTRTGVARGLSEAAAAALPPPLWEDMLVGGLAGGFGALVTNPMDVVKTRVMTSTTSRGFVQTATLLLKEEGPRAFFKGTTPRLVHKVPANAVFFTMYEAFRVMLGVAKEPER